MLDFIGLNEKCPLSETCELKLEYIAWTTFFPSLAPQQRKTKNILIYTFLLNTSLLLPPFAVENKNWQSQVYSLKVWAKFGHLTLKPVRKKSKTKQFHCECALGAFAIILDSILQNDKCHVRRKRILLSKKSWFDLNILVLGGLDRTGGGFEERALQTHEGGNPSANIISALFQHRFYVIFEIFPKRKTSLQLVISWAIQSIYTIYNV